MPRRASDAMWLQLEEGDRPRVGSCRSCGALLLPLSQEFCSQCTCSSCVQDRKRGSENAAASDTTATSCGSGTQSNSTRSFAGFSDTDSNLAAADDVCSGGRDAVPAEARRTETNLKRGDATSLNPPDKAGLSHGYALPTPAAGSTTYVSAAPPPVGTLLELLCDDNVWRRVTVVTSGDNQACVRFCDGEQETLVFPDDSGSVRAYQDPPPPVGTLLELLCDDNVWRRVIVVTSGDNQACVRFGDGELETLVFPDDSCNVRAYQDHRPHELRPQNGTDDKESDSEDEDSDSEDGDSDSEDGDSDSEDEDSDREGEQERNERADTVGNRHAKQAALCAPASKGRELRRDTQPRVVASSYML